MYKRQAENLAYVRRLSKQTDFKDDTLICAGDVTDSPDTLRETLQCFTAAFGTVFFTPGNHEFWVRGRSRDAGDSLEKLAAIFALCDELGVRPLLVFDGGELPMKARQNRGRRESRGEHREAAAQLRAQGREREAWAQEQKGVSVSSAMVHATIAEIRARGVPFVVAPYEADAQLAHLVESGHAAAALTEDSDLLPFGCPRTLYKMEPSGGCCLLYTSPSPRD